MEVHKELRPPAESSDISNGAALGFIEMERKASEPLEFHVTAVDDKQYVFSITTLI
jgi:hypothetical protein